MIFLLDDQRRSCVRLQAIANRLDLKLSASGHSLAMADIRCGWRLPDSTRTVLAIYSLQISWDGKTIAVLTGNACGLPVLNRRWRSRDDWASSRSSLRAAAVAQVSGLHHHRRFDAGHGHRCQRGGFQRYERADSAPAECAQPAKPLFYRACQG